MASFKFNLLPKKVEIVSSKNRRIISKIPHPKSIKILKSLRNMESENAIEQLPIIWDKALGAKIYDPYGNIFIDFTSSIFVTNSGHGNKLIIDQVNKILKKPLLHSYYYPTKIRESFLKSLLKITPKNLNKCILLSAGTEATERAIKIAKIYGKQNNKKYIIAWQGNYHGKTLNAQMISGNINDHTWIDNFDKNIIHLPFPYPWIKKSPKKIFQEHINILKKKKISPNQIAAFFVESFQGWGALFYPKEYIELLRSFCSKNKSLLIFDEIQAGFYRTGKLFGFQNYGVKADLVICGKGISGSLPLSAVLGESKYINLDSSYTSTHGGHPVACASALGNLNTFKSSKFINNLKTKSQILERSLKAWKNKYPDRIYGVYGKGMIFGVLINEINNKDKLDNNLVNAICEKAMQKGVFSICTGRGSLKLGPPINITKSELKEGLKVYEECFDEMF